MIFYYLMLNIGYCVYLLINFMKNIFYIDLLLFFLLQGKYRFDMQEEWVRKLDENKVLRIGEFILVVILFDSVKVRSWQIVGFFKDNLSIENGVIVKYFRRWFFFIDFQGQVNRWVKNMVSIGIIKLFLILNSRELLQVYFVSVSKVFNLNFVFVGARCGFGCD